MSARRLTGAIGTNLLKAAHTIRVCLEHARWLWTASRQPDALISAPPRLRP